MGASESVVVKTGAALDAMTKPRRLHATLEIKSLQTPPDDPDGPIELEGMASTPTPDRMGDIVEPLGALFALPMPLLLQHDSHKPIGLVHWLAPTKKGLPFKATVDRADPAVPYIAEARAHLRAGRLRGVSIGFIPRDMEPLDAKDPWGAQHIKTLELLELSPVTIPANAEATIHLVKSFDVEPLAAPGPMAGTTSQRVTLFPSPGATGQSKGSDAMDATVQTAPWEQKRAALVAQAEAIMSKSNADGSTLSDDDAERYDGVLTEIQAVDKHITRQRAHERLLGATAAGGAPVTAAAATDEKAASKLRAGELILLPNANLPKGIGLARYVKAFAQAKGNYREAAEYAQQWANSTPEVVEALKTAVSAGTTTDNAWAGPLVYSQNLASEFVEYLRPTTILGKIDGFRRVPFNVRFPTQTSGSTVGWVGQGAPKPVSSLVFSSGSLGFAKAAGIVVITMELARFSSPSAELLIRNDLAAAMRAFLDVQFIDPSVAAVANVSPASVTNGATAVKQASGAWTTIAVVDADVASFYANFTGGNIDLTGAYWVMTPDLALQLSMIRTTQGEHAYPDITMQGGMFQGLPVITSNSVPHSVSAGSVAVLVIPSEIFMADDGGIAIDTSTEASLQMDTAPTVNSTTPTATQLVSMFQTNSIAIRVERIINWARRRTLGAGYIDNIH